MKEFKFLKDVQERTYSTHLRAFLDEDEFSLRARMLREPGGPERVWMVKRLLVEFLLSQARSSSTEFPWGVIHIVSAEMFFDNDGNACARGRAVITEVNQPSYNQSITIFGVEYATIKQMIENE